MPRYKLELGNLWTKTIFYYFIDVQIIWEMQYKIYILYVNINPTLSFSKPLQSSCIPELHIFLPDIH